MCGQVVVVVVVMVRGDGGLGVRAREVVLAGQRVCSRPRADAPCRRTAVVPPPYRCPRMHAPHNAPHNARPNAQRVFYFWGLQQDEAGPVVLPNGSVLPPRWVIKDMVWQGHLALV